MMNKKAQGLSINVIIIVAIALVVLVVLIAIFTGRLGGFVAGVGETTTCDIGCQGIGLSGNDVAKDSCTDEVLPGTFSDVDDTEECCCATPT
jgi:flagellar basal body-associated protein FliL